MTELIANTIIAFFSLVGNGLVLWVAAIFIVGTFTKEKSWLN